MSQLPYQKEKLALPSFPWLPALLQRKFSCCTLEGKLAGLPWCRLASPLKQRARCPRFRGKQDGERRPGKTQVKEGEVSGCSCFLGLPNSTLPQTQQITNSANYKFSKFH